MNGVIVYQSKYGATRTYTEWLAESLVIDLFNVKDRPSLDWTQYEFLIFASSVYVGKILIAKYIKKNWLLLQQKKLYLLVVGGTSPEKTQEIETILTSNFKQVYLQKIRWYYALGRHTLWYEDSILRPIGFFQRHPLRPDQQ